MSDKLKKIGAAIVGLLVLVLYILGLRSKNNKLEAQLENSEMEKKDAVLESQQDENSDTISKEKEKMKLIPKPDLANMTESEIKEYWEKQFNGK